MTQPNAGDYVPLGGKSATPSASTPGSASGDDNGVSVHGTSVVQLQEEAWRARAEAARVAAEELRTCKHALASALTFNYFGDGCVEGTAVYDALRLVLVEDSGWSGDLASQIKGLDALAKACLSAADSLSTTDTRNSASLTVST